jgi:hypothetical protein
VLVASPTVRALPIVTMLAERAPAAYLRAGLPPVEESATAAQRRGWLTNPSIRRAYLAGEPDSPASYLAAVSRFGNPLGPAVTLPGGLVAQAFADVVLEAPSRGGSAHAVALTRTALAARVLTVPGQARVPQSAPPIPNAFPNGPPQPTTAVPFAVDLGAILILYGTVVLPVAFRRRRGLADRPQRSGGT